MGHTCGMSRDDLHFRLRIPAPLKEKIEAAAADNHRSMTAEIISRLEASFNEDQSLSDHEERLRLLEERINRWESAADFLGPKITE